MHCGRLFGRSRSWLIRPDDAKGNVRAARAPMAGRLQFRQLKHNGAILLVDQKQLNLGSCRVAGQDPSRTCAFATRRWQSAVTVRGSRWSAAGCRSNTQLTLQILTGRFTKTRDDRTEGVLFRSFKITALDRVNANAITFIDERWYLDDDTVFQGGRLINI